MPPVVPARALSPRFLPGLTALLAFTAMAGGEPAEKPAEKPVGSFSIQDVLDSIEEMESSQDAKCYATATRLEDFLYGTPLSPSARFRKIDLQKERIAGLWLAASRQAQAVGADQVGLAQMQPLLRAALSSHQAGDGSVVVTLAGEGSLTLERRDIEHYSSVAYAWRALLAVQQDAQLGGEVDLLPADDETLDAMRRFLDLHTLAALSLADRSARLASEPEISEEGLVRAWRRLEAAASGSAGEAAAPDWTGAPAPPAADLSLLRAIIDGKFASYRAYNRLEGDPTLLFRANLQHYYLRYPLPDTMQGVLDLEARLDRSLRAFVEQHLAAAAARAAAAGRGLVRAEDAAASMQGLTPHTVNRFEDVTFFPRLRRERQVVLEAYDLDSFRDLGLHWKVIGAVVAADGFTLPRAPDPFAAELLAEGAAQYGLLLLRVAGELAREAAVPNTLPEHVDAAARMIVERSRRDAAAPEITGDDGRLVSAAGASAPSAEGTFFTDVTVAVGLEFEHRSSNWLSHLRRDLVVSPPTFSGGGIAAEDVNGDGYPDLLLVGGQGNALLLNDGQGHFVDVTELAGIRAEDEHGHAAEARQPLIADFDNDGRQDILITYVNDRHRLYRGLGEARFEDVSEAAGLGGAGLIGGPATTLDFDGDGLLDLYIGYFGNYLEGALPNVARHNDNALPNRLLRNLGGMKFRDVTDGSGAGDTGWAQAVSHTDFDLDGRQDLIVANDYGRNAFLRNQGDGTFRDMAAELGTDEPSHSMNIGLADLNWDNYPDIYISNIVAMVKDDRYVLPDEDTPRHFDPRTMARMRVVESNVLHVSQVREGRLSYVNSGAVTRGANSTGWAWDADFFDFDNDGDDDLYCVNGTNDYFIFAETRYQVNEGEMQPVLYTYSRESNVLFVNEGDELRNESGRSGADFVGTSRSAVYLDYDGDGDLDVVVNNFHGQAVFLRNNAELRGNHWLKVRLVGDPARGSNRDSIGARLLVRTTSGGRVWREVHGGTGYLSMDPKEQHFGLAGDDRADLWIRWPDGEEQVLRGLAADRLHVIEQAKTPAAARGPR